MFKVLLIAIHWPCDEAIRVITTGMEIVQF